MSSSIWRLWKTEIAKRDLRNPLDVQALYGIAERLQIVKGELARAYVFEQAAVQLRMNETGEAVTPTGLFASNVASNRWIATFDDEEKARFWIGLVDRDEQMVRDKPHMLRSHDRYVPMKVKSRNAAEMMQHLQASNAALALEEKPTAAPVPPAPTLAELEESHGTALNSMSDGECTALAKPGLLDVIRTFQARGRSWRNEPMIRRALLSAIAAGR